MRKSLLLGVAAVVALAVGVYFLRQPGGDADRPVTLFQWEDYTDQAFLAEYQTTRREKPQTAIFADEDEAFAKMRAGFKPDVMGPCYYEFPRWREAGLLKPIDTARLKNWNKISATLRTLPGIDAGNGRVWFVPHYWGNTSITIRTDLAPEYAQSQSWEILFDPKYKGRIAVLDGVDDVVPFIARMIGIDRAFGKVCASSRIRCPAARRASGHHGDGAMLATWPCGVSQGGAGGFGLARPRAARSVASLCRAKRAEARRPQASSLAGSGPESRSASPSTVVGTCGMFSTMHRRWATEP